MVCVSVALFNRSSRISAWLSNVIDCTLRAVAYAPVTMIASVLICAPSVVLLLLLVVFRASPVIVRACAHVFAIRVALKHLLTVRVCFIGITTISGARIHKRCRLNTTNTGHLMIWSSCSHACGSAYGLDFWLSCVSDHDSESGCDYVYDFYHELDYVIDC